VLAPHPAKAEFDAFWLAGGRLVDWGPLPDGCNELLRRTEAALARGGRIGELGAHVAPDEVDELRIIDRWLASHPEAPRLMLSPAPDQASLAAFAARGSASPREVDYLAAGTSASQGELHDLAGDRVGSDLDG
jgi:DNA polymerase III subunit epsilon